MPAPFDVAVIVGSLRKDSLNRKAAKVLMALAPASLKPRLVELGELPLYNSDLDATPPAAWTAFREAVKPAAAVLFVTPEYNRSMPGVLKNAIDVGSRPPGAGALQHKAGAVVSVSLGVMGGFGSSQHLRQSAIFLDIAVMPQPEMYIGRAATLFDANGELTSEDTKKLFASFMTAFAAWVDKQAK